ncbi:hypothetical protein RO3G_13597 [Rhizopus delemar RA 99-880]|uniref:Uncharacterized protein n=1 Tax=Rhizopus delemar (strain RA 99-880 / ATCC MYA-4621 / FGSC 9543 / NRRL 43880) TaxID=246409 RepID=I1CKA6_RHIO9|nr:hypothetical protein RO3G_13597 [Rhizopus delemar RA 99-880]|eukprot:EIE88886.1 hypothetical protein RO3G_13597 [Rhizopus delemar RA 99-880]
MANRDSFKDTKLGAAKYHKNCVYRRKHTVENVYLAMTKGCIQHPFYFVDEVEVENLLGMRCWMIHRRHASCVRLYLCGQGWNIPSSFDL